MIYKRFYREIFDARGVLTGAELTYPPNFNFGYDVTDPLADLYPDKLALLWQGGAGGTESKRLTFGALRRLSNRAAAALQEIGLHKGDVLTVSLRTRWEYWPIALAAHKLGLLLSPVFHLLSPGDLAFRLRRSGSRAILCLAETPTVERVRAAAGLAGLTALYTVGGTGAPPEGFRDFSLLMETAPELSERVETDARDAILLYFTSGTTGVPKGVLHDHVFTLPHALAARYMMDIQRDGLHFATGNTAWEVVCGTKFYGQWLVESAFLVLDYERFDPAFVLKTLSAHKISTMMAQPTVYRALTDAGMDKYDLSSVSCFAVGGEKLSPDLAEAVQKQTGHVLYEGYAQSEAGLIACAAKNWGMRPGSVGKSFSKYRVGILREDGSLAETGERGEIVLLTTGGTRPAGLFAGYFTPPGETERGTPDADTQLLRADYYPTGDMGYLDGDGFLYYLGRLDGVIKTKGYRVSPLEIENALSRHPAVAECLVLGDKDRDWGEKIHAYVRPAPGFAPGEALRGELLAFYNESATPYMKIRVLTFVAALEKNENGKLLRKIPANDN